MGITNEKDKWIEQLIPFVMNNGFHQISVEEMVKTVGTTKVNFYKHFQSKEELVLNIVQGFVNQFNQFQDYLFDVNESFIRRDITSLKHVISTLSGVSNQFLIDVQKVFPDKIDLLKRNVEQSIRVAEGFYIKGVITEQVHPFNLKVSTILDQLYITKIFDGDFLSKNGLTLESAFASYILIKHYGLVNFNKLTDEDKAEIVSLVNKYNPK